MSRRALIIGIDDYDKGSSLGGCVNDAIAMQAILERHENGDLNFECRLFTSPGKVPVTRKLLREKLEELFNDFTGDILFYFSGHGMPTKFGGFLVTQDATRDDPGVAMNDLLHLANTSHARSIFLILDCCHSGDLGNPPNMQGGDIENRAQLKEGLTILAASRATQVAIETDGNGLFTNLILGALRGGAADIRGNVSAASIYGYAAQALTSWDQTPVYKSHAYQLPPIRKCLPAVQDSLLRELPTIFETAESLIRMNKSYEHTESEALPENVTLFDKFKLLRNARLLTTEENRDLYYVAIGSMTVRLTELGQFYWYLARSKKI
jgi:hypothetical protein